MQMLEKGGKTRKGDAVERINFSPEEGEFHLSFSRSDPGWVSLQLCSIGAKSDLHESPPAGGSPARGADWHLKPSQCDCFSMYIRLEHDYYS